MTKKKSKASLFLVVIPLIFVGCFTAIFFLDMAKGKPELDSPLIVTSQPSSAVYFTMKQERSRGRRLPEGNLPSTGSGRRGRQWYDYNRYTLHVLDPATGKPAREPMLLAEHGSQSRIPQPELFGATSTHLYLYANGLRAYKLPELTPVFTDDQVSALKIEEAGNTSGPPLSSDFKNYRVIPALDAFVIRGNDAAYYVLNPSTAKLEPLSEDKLVPLFRTNTAQDGFNFSPNPGRFRRILGGSDVMTSELKVGDEFFTLLTSDARKTLRPSGSSDASNSGYQTARMLFRAKRLPPRDPEDSRYRDIDLTSVTSLSDKRFISAGFLYPFNAHFDTWSNFSTLFTKQREARPEKTHLGDAESFLILSRASLAESAEYELTRVTFDGKTTYSVALPLAEIRNVAYTADHGTLVFTGFPNYKQPLSTRPFHFVTVNTKTGAFTTYETPKK